MDASEGNRSTFRRSNPRKFAIIASILSLRIIQGRRKGISVGYQQQKNFAEALTPAEEVRYDGGVAPVEGRRGRVSRVARAGIDRLLRVVGARAVGATWGPRGFRDSLVRAKRAGVCVEEVVDVGAACGEWTRECLQVFPDAKYFLVEPLIENETFLEALAANHSNVHYWIGAAGATHNSKELYVHGDQSSFYSSEFGRVAARPISVRPLDSFLGRELHRPALIKADVQGHELEVLAGAERCLATAQLVLLEVSFRRIYAGAPLAHEVIAFMASKGFRILDFCSYALRPFDGELAQSDMLFACKGSPVFDYEGYA